MKITKDMTVGEVIRKFPKTREILLKHGLCDCCGGHLSLEDGAKIHKANVSALVKELNSFIE